MRGVQGSNVFMEDGQSRVGWAVWWQWRGGFCVSVYVCMVMVKRKLWHSELRVRHTFLVSQENSPGVEILLYVQSGSSNEHLLNS